MSLHPTKKSDMGKAWLSKRIDRVKKIQPEYHLIVTEGKQTEPKYFGAIRDLINSRYREKIHLEIYGEGDNTISLFEKAKMRAENDPNGCKHVWVVYDKDDFPPEHFDTTAELCKQSSNDRTTYHAIWSNQCMELWYLPRTGCCWQWHILPYYSKDRPVSFCRQCSMRGTTVRS